MRRILSANVSAFGPVINAILLFVVTLAIYAVIAVNIFDNGDGGKCFQDGACFSSFSVAFYSLLGVATGESWTPYIHNLNVDGVEGVDVSVAVFFLSFVGLVSIVALNVRLCTHTCLGMRACMHACGLEERSGRGENSPHTKGGEGL